MIILKFFFISSLLILFETLNADKCNEKKITFSVGKIWQSYKQKGDYCVCGVDEWKKGVQEHYDGCRKATWEFRGPSRDFADNVMKSFEILLTKLIYFTNSNSTMLASSSHAILESISKCSKLGISGLNIIKEFDKVLPGLIEEFNNIATKLSDIIGQLADSFTDALSNFGCAFTNFMSEFISAPTNQVDYVPVLKQFQKVMSTLASIAEILLNGRELVTRGANEAVTILTLIVHYIVISTQGINSCYQTVLYEQNCTVPQKTELCSVPLENVLLGVTRTVDSVAFPYTESTKAQLTSLVNITMSFNGALKDIIGPFQGVTINGTRHNAKSITSVKGVTKGLNDT